MGLTMSEPNLLPPRILAVPMSVEELMDVSGFAAEDETDAVEYAEFVLLNISLADFSCFGPEKEQDRCATLRLHFTEVEYAAIEESAREANSDILTYARRLLLEVPSFVLPWHPRHPAVSE
jgi:hypothetical protein